MKLRTKLLAVGAAIGISIAGIAAAQVTGVVVVTSLAGAFSLPINTSGPQSAIVPLNGGTFTCSSGTATVANTNVNAGSIITSTLKTAAGTVAAHFIATITAGTGFTVTCGGSDTSVYNYVIMG